MTFTEVVEGKEWGSFYYSFKVSFLPATLHTDIIMRLVELKSVN